MRAPKVQQRLRREFERQTGLHGRDVQLHRPVALLVVHCVRLRLGGPRACASARRVRRHSRRQFSPEVRPRCRRPALRGAGSVRQDLGGMQRRAGPHGAKHDSARSGPGFSLRRNVRLQGIVRDRREASADHRLCESVSDRRMPGVGRHTLLHPCRARRHQGRGEDRAGRQHRRRRTLHQFPVDRRASAARPRRPGPRWSRRHRGHRPEQAGADESAIDQHRITVCGGSRRAPLYRRARRKGPRRWLLLPPRALRSTPRSMRA